MPRLIAGPTASGKSSAALALAERLDGEIVNADAMQVYSDLRVLTARPSTEEEACVPHHLYGCMDGRERCSAGVWARMAAESVNDIIARNHTPIIVGGTGLYFKSLVEGLSPIPDVSQEVRDQGNALYEEMGGDAFRDLVLQQDELLSHLAAGDRQRLVRAWEVYEATGTPLSEFQQLPRQPLMNMPYKAAVLTPPREVLYQRCNDRLEAMLREGALEEVRQLMERGLPDDLPVMKSLGVPEFAAHLRGEISLEAAMEMTAQSTRRFAKRQMTWFRGQAADWPMVETTEELLRKLA